MKLLFLVIVVTIGVPSMPLARERESASPGHPGIYSNKTSVTGQVKMKTCGQVSPEKVAFAD